MITQTGRNIAPTTRKSPPPRTHISLKRFDFHNLEYPDPSQPKGVDQVAMELLAEMHGLMASSAIPPVAAKGG